MRRAAVIVTFVSLPFVLASPGSPAMAGAPGPRVAVPSHAAAAPARPAANDTCSGSESAPKGVGASRSSSRAAAVEAAARSGRSRATRSIPAHPDFNGDGFADLAIAEACLDSQGGVMDAGAVFIVYGGTNGLTVGGPPANQFWTENSNGLQGGAAVSGDAFGHVMATGDFNAD